MLEQIKQIKVDIFLKVVLSFLFLGLALDLPLLDWLEKYTFPTEAKFKDIDFANEVIFYNTFLYFDSYFYNFQQT